MSPIRATPATMVQKITGAMPILMSLMKASPNGFSATPTSGQIAPTAIPSAMPTSTCT